MAAIQLPANRHGLPTDVRRMLRRTLHLFAEKARWPGLRTSGD